MPTGSPTATAAPLGLLRCRAGSSAGALPLGGLTHPAPLAAMALLAVNDHLLKGSGLLPGWLTGKLSDLAGLLFFPLLLVALVSVGRFAWERLRGGPGDGARRASTDPRGLLVACAATGVVFSAVQLVPAAAAAYVGIAGALGFPSVVTQDPTDLVALAVLPLAYWIGARPDR